MNFRKDINGLRAYAVLFVLLFHFEFSGFGGGFIGVDIFFVLSGYLMTQIIFSGLERGDFSIVTFYRKRIERIVPALVVLSIVLLAFGAVFVYPEGLKELAKHALSSLTFVSNFIYWKEINYFDTGVVSKWLIHTWSLSVEAQFYVLYPVVLLLARKLLGKDRLRLFVLLLFLASFGYCLLSQTWSGSYYLLTNRAWELLIGGLVYLFPIQLGRRTSIALEALGIAGIVGSAVLLGKDMPWPGTWSSVPILATALVLVSQREESLLTANPVAQFLGKISYSTYLWHWPLLVGCHFMGLGQNRVVLFGALVASILLGYLSFAFVEPLGKKVGGGRKARYASLGIYASLIAVLALVFFGGGLGWRTNPSYTRAVKDLHMPTVSNGYGFYSVDTVDSLEVGPRGWSTVLGDTQGARKAVLFGDSFAAQYEPFWDVLGKKLNLSVQTVTTNWGYPSFSAGFTGPEDAQRAYEQTRLNRDYVRTNLGRWDVVILGGQWWKVVQQGELHNVVETIREIAAKTDTVILMPEPRQWSFDPMAATKAALWIGLRPQIGFVPSYKEDLVVTSEAQLRDQVSGMENVLFLEREALFQKDGAELMTNENGIPISLDGGHISVLGSLLVAEAFQGSSAWETLQSRVLRDRKGTR